MISPEVFQARIGSCKGLWLVDLDMDGDAIEIRKKQSKWDMNWHDCDKEDRCFEVKDWSRQHAAEGVFNVQLIPILEDPGLRFGEWHPPCLLSVTFLQGINDICIFLPEICLCFGTKRRCRSGIITAITPQSPGPKGLAPQPIQVRSTRVNQTGMCFVQMTPHTPCPV